MDFQCEFEQQEVKFLGHIVGAHGVRVDPAKTEIIQNWQPPTNVQGVRSFVGLATYFCKFRMVVLHCGEVATAHGRALQSD